MDERLKSWAPWDNVQRLGNEEHCCFVCRKTLSCDRIRHFGSDINSVGYDDIIHYIKSGTILRFPCGHCPDSKHVGCKLNKGKRLFQKYKIGTDIEGSCCRRIFCNEHVPKDVEWEVTRRMEIG